MEEDKRECVLCFNEVDEEFSDDYCYECQNKIWRQEMKHLNWEYERGLL